MVKWGSMRQIFQVSCNPSVPQTCLNETVNVKIVDYIPGFATLITLNQPPFATIANMNTGSVSVNVLSLNDQTLNFFCLRHV